MNFDPLQRISESLMDELIAKKPLNTPTLDARQSLAMISTSSSSDLRATRRIVAVSLEMVRLSVGNRDRGATRPTHTVTRTPSGKSRRGYLRAMSPFVITLSPASSVVSK